MSDEESSTKPAKEEEIFGFKVQNLTALGTILALGGIGYLIWDKLKPQLPGAGAQAQQQPQVQQQQQPQQQYTPEQIQQIQAQQAAAAQQQQQPQEPVQYGYAVEQDPMSGKITKARVREIEATEQAPDRFSSISV